jgi:hypothetical protein
MNVYNRYYKQVKECPPSGTTEEEWYKIAADNYRDAEGRAFVFIHCVEVLHQLPKFNPMIDDADRSSDVVAEDSDADKKPAASVNKIGAPMGASLKRPPGSKKAKNALERHQLVRINCSWCSCHGYNCGQSQQDCCCFQEANRAV